MSTETAEQTSLDDALDAEFEKALNSESEASETEVVGGDTDGQAESTQSESTEKAADQTDETAEEHELLSKEDRDKLTPKEKEAYKKLMSSYTQKTQTLAEKRKETEQLQERYSKFDKYADLLEAWEKDPQETLRQLNQMHGFKTDSNGQDTKTESEIPSFAKDLRDLLGEGNESFADQLAAKIDNRIESRARELADERVKPIVTQQQAIAERESAKQAEADMKAFEARHPDWQEFEPKIVEIGKQIRPAPGMDLGDYMDVLYTLATQNRSKAETTTQVLDNLKKVVQNAEPQSHGVKEQIVTKTAPEFKNFDDAFEQAAAAAAKGERWEQ